MRNTLSTIALTLLAAQAQAAADCPAAAPRTMVERFISADCESCWQAGTALSDPQAFVLDWIAPGQRGSDAPLAVAAMPEAAERAGSLAADAALSRSQALPRPAALQIDVLDGPSMNGYIGLQMSVRLKGKRAPGNGLAGYLAVVERIAAGSEGNPVARQLVRSVIGPFPLVGLRPGHPVVEVRASRFPENAKPERLTAVGWVESAEGQPLAVANAPFVGCLGVNTAGAD